MVRNYKPRPGHRQYKRYSAELIKKAYKEFANGEGTLTAIARKYNISKSCLFRRVHQKVHYEVGGQRAFTSEREEHIIKYIHSCAPWQYHLQIWDLQLLIKLYLDRRAVITKRKFDNNVPGTEFVTKFLKRQEDNISQRVIQTIHDNGAITTEAILSYFHELRMCINDVDTSNIVCFNDIVTDELEDSQFKNREDYKINNAFIMLTASASGEILQPYISYKDKPCYEKSARRSIMSKHSHQARKRLNGSIFEDWFKTVILPYYEGRPGKKCLVGGFFSTRISKEIAISCREQNIYFIFLPDNANNFTQPLNLFTELINSTFQQRKENGSGTITKESFCGLIQTLINDSKDIVVEGFKKTGINPFNPMEVLTQLPDFNETTVENVDTDFEKDNKTLEQEVVQVKQEVDCSDDIGECSDNTYDGEIEIDFTKNEVRDEKSFKVERLFNAKRTNDPINFAEFGIKLSPVDSHDSIGNEDVSVNRVAKNVEDDIDLVPRSSRGRKIKLKKRDDYSSDSDYNPTLQEKNSKRRVKIKINKMSTGSTVPPKKRNTKVSDNASDIDPLSNSQSEMNLSTESQANGPSQCKNGKISKRTCGATTKPENRTSDSAIPFAHMENKVRAKMVRKRHIRSSICGLRGTEPVWGTPICTCHTHTQLLEAILSTMSRQEKLQERSTIAMEAQAMALSNIALMLDRQMNGNTNT